MANELQVRANRANAELSTGPKTEDGRLTASRNATRHGILTGQLLLEHEDPAKLEALRVDVGEALQPSGALEEILAERIVAAIWRQHRLIAAESAAIQLDMRPKLIAKKLAELDDPYHFANGDTALLEPFDEDQLTWCNTVLKEFEGLDSFDLETLEQEAPHIYGQLAGDAEEDNQPVAEYVADLRGDLSSYMVELMSWCRKQVQEADERPRLLALADQLRRAKLVLPLKHLDLLARYQTTLDNQLYKALRALREAQEWRQAQDRSAGDEGER